MFSVSGAVEILGGISLSEQVFYRKQSMGALLCGFCVKKGFNMVDNSAGSMISSATGIFLSFLHATVGRERLVYFIVS